MERSFVWLAVFFMGLTLSLSVFAGEAREKQDNSAVMAGFMYLPTEHGCTSTYKSCSLECKKSDNRNCEQECMSDCGVCALDFGEEDKSVCHR